MGGGGFAVKINLIAVVLGVFSDFISCHDKASYLGLKEISGVGQNGAKVHI